ncbi:MAG: DUF4129 domain-containing transglutaminase family protein [Armatimonadota bacterium]
MSAEARLERIAAFFHLPHWPYDPQREVEREGQGTWRRLTIACWTMMLPSLVATYIAGGQPVICSFLGLLLIIALPVSYRLHFRSTSRLLVNWATFTPAFILGWIVLAPLWPLRHGMWSAENLDFMSFLILCFMWITAFRAFAVRTVRDLVETILPCGSIILLTLVVRPTPLALGCMALVVLGALALLAAEHSISSRQQYHPLVTVTRTHTRRRAGAFYSWPTLYALVLIAAMLVSYTGARSELSNSWADYVRYTLAWQVMRYFQPHENFMMPDAGVMLWRLNNWPNSERPVFRARTKIPGNWRIGVYHTYEKQWWHADRQKLTVAERDGQGWVVPLEGSGAAKLGGTMVEQQITAIKYLQVSVPTLFCPVRAEINQKKIRYDTDRLVKIPRFIPPGQTVKVISYLPPVLPIQRQGTEVPEEILAQDLQLPADLPQRVRELAVELTREALTPYEKARAIEQHLMYEYKYTLAPPISRPNDFIDYFLFESKRGFCHHFAGSMVIMCRAIGLPTRLASGYLRGEEDQEDSDLYTVREKDAHVWPEVYFKGAGWISFEPTPPEPEETSTFQKAYETITKAGRSYGVSGYAFLRDYWPSLAIALAALLVLGGLGRQQARGRYLRAYRGADPETRIVRAYLRMRRLLAERGASDAVSLTPREFLAQLPPELAHLRQEASLLTENYLQARFGRAQASLDQSAAAEETLAALQRTKRRPADPVAP